MAWVYQPKSTSGDTGWASAWPRSRWVKCPPPGRHSHGALGQTRPRFCPSSSSLSGTPTHGNREPHRGRKGEVAGPGKKVTRALRGFTTAEGPAQGGGAFSSAHLFVTAGPCRRGAGPQGPGVEAIPFGPKRSQKQRHAPHPPTPEMMTTEAGFLSKNLLPTGYLGCASATLMQVALVREPGWGTNPA